ncbi:hypothetical protein QTN25_002365 [Entamoeba marina]
MDPRSAKAFAERRDLYYDDKHDYDGDGVADVVGASYDGTNYNTEMFNGISRGGDPDQYREYQTNENALKGLILNGEKQIEYNVWFPLSQKRSEKDEDYATNLADRDAWIGTARQFLTNNGVNPDTFEQVQ